MHVGREPNQLVGLQILYIISPNLIQVIFNSMTVYLFVKMKYWPIVYGVCELIAVSGLYCLLAVLTLIIERCDSIADDRKLKRPDEDKELPRPEDQEPPS
jgi:hypothetical protein